MRFCSQIYALVLITFWGSGFKCVGKWIHSSTWLFSWFAELAGGRSRYWLIVHSRSVRYLTDRLCAKFVIQITALSPGTFWAQNFSTWWGRCLPPLECFLETQNLPRWRLNSQLIDCQMLLCLQMATMSKLQLLILIIFCWMYIFTGFSVHGVNFLRMLCFIIYRSKLIVLCICVHLIDKIDLIAYSYTSPCTFWGS